MFEQVMTGAVVLATAAATARICIGRRDRRIPAHVDLAHLLMGVGMVVMHWASSPVLAVPFVVFGCGLGLRAAKLRTGSHLHHAIGSLAMAYMFAGQQTGAAGAPLVAVGHHHAPVTVAATGPGLALPLLGWALMSYCVLSAGFAAADLARTPPPRLRSLVELALSIAMAHMLLVML